MEYQLLISEEYEYGDKYTPDNGSHYRKISADTNIEAIRTAQNILSEIKEKANKFNTCEVRGELFKMVKVSDVKTNI